jgi:prolyl oligopeptidase
VDSRSTVPPYPPSRREDKTEVFHGRELVDPYQWLEDGSSAETLQWIAAQNAFARSLLDRLPDRASTTERLRELLLHDWVSMPIERCGNYYFMKRRATDDQPCIYRRRGIHGSDELLVDAHSLSPDHSASIVMHEPSSDARLLLYGVRMTGVDETDLRVFDVENERELPDRIAPALHYKATWKRDSSGFYYFHRARGENPRIRFHVLGTDAVEDRDLFGEGYGPETWLDVVESEDGRYLFLKVGWGWRKDEWYVRDLREDSPPRPLIFGIDANFMPDFTADSLIVRTDWKAPCGRIIKIDFKDPSPQKWREIVPEAQDAIQASCVIGEKLFVNYLHNVTSRISIFSLEGEPLGELPVPENCVAGVYGRFGHDEGGVHFSSYTMPTSIYRYRSSTGELTLWHRNAAPFDSNQFETREVWYSSKDGTRVPMFLVHRQGIPLDGARPTVLYGYGGFNLPLLPGFSPGAAWWVEQGGVYAVPSLRGGGEFGAAWHEGGMLANKQNVFDDFIAAAEWLIASGYTSPNRLAISGISNGGLLVGAVMTQRPELMSAALCAYPDLDLIRFRRYNQNNNLPALFEYGDPADPNQFKFIAAYSPYEHVRAGVRYPAVLFVTGEADTRVPPAQARKMTARMQTATASGLPILLLHDPKSGHAGGRGLEKIIEEMSLEWSFLAWQLGV